MKDKNISKDKRLLKKHGYVILHEALDRPESFISKMFEKEKSEHEEYISKKETLNLDYPTFNEVLAYRFELHVWSLGDHYYKLAERYYGDPNYWWVIAWFNKKPTEGHVKAGDIIRIPTPLGQVLTDIGY